MRRRHCSWFQRIDRSCSNQLRAQISDKQTFGAKILRIYPSEWVEIQTRLPNSNYVKQTVGKEPDYSNITQ